MGKGGTAYLKQQMKMDYKIYNVETLNRLSIDCHQRSVDKGFWDEKHTIYHCLMLAFGELHEAIEADRLGKWIKLTPEQIEELRGLEGEAYAQAFLRMIKDTVGDEIADAVIRLLDLLGCMLKGVDLTQEDLNMTPGAYDKNTPPRMLTDAMFVVISGSFYAVGYGKEFMSALSPLKSIEQLCYHLGIDLMAHIELKMRYNETRPRLHGKKY